jgi:dienelactone hydrolase
MTSRFLCLLVALPALAAQPVPQDLAPHFLPPPDFAAKLGDYPSPLRFKDGREVKTKEDWAARRTEILQEWHALMGSWPEVLEKPALEVLETRQRDGFTQHRVRVQIAPEQTGLGYLLVPAGAGPFPAAFVPFYDPETSVGLTEKPLRDFAYQLTKRGFVTLSIGSPGGDARTPVLTRGAQCQPLSYLAYVAANGWQTLANRPEVDAKRIGVVGHSYGGKWAMFAACLWEKYACGVWSDPGIVFDESRGSINYQEPWYLGLDPKATRKPGLVKADNPRTGAYKRLIEEKHDLTELQALMAPRPFLVSGGAEDPPKRWLALNHITPVYELLGIKNGVAMTNRKDHSPNEESNEVIYRFMEWALK